MYKSVCACVVFLWVCFYCICADIVCAAVTAIIIKTRNLVSISIL